MEIELLTLLLDGMTQIFQSEVSKDRARVPVALEQIAVAALQAYQKETGQPLDPEKIRPFVAL